MSTLPEIRGSCRREVQAWKWVICLLAYTEKRVVEINFRESVTEGVCRTDCVPED